MAKQIVTIVWCAENEKAAIDIATEIFNWANKGLSSVHIKNVKDAPDVS
jgi:hypothetical protein